MPRNAAQGGKRNGLSFLKIDNLSTDKRCFKILWAGLHQEADMGNKFNHALLVKIEATGNMEKFWLSMDEKSEVLKTMDANLGNDETKWNGREIFLFIEKHELNETSYMRCEVKPIPANPAAAAEAPAKA